LVVCFAVLSATGFAAKQTGKCGKNITWSFDNETDELVVSGHGSMEGCSWGENDTIKTLIVEKGVTTVGSFKGVTSLQSVVLGENVETIEDFAFISCDNLINVTLPKNAKVAVGNHAFYYCSNLTNLVNVESIVSIGASAFWGCNSIESIVIPSAMTEIKDSTFAFCLGLDSVVIPASVTDIESEAFLCCTGLKSVTYFGTKNPNCNASDNVFHECFALMHVLVPENYEDDNFCGVPVKINGTSSSSLLIPSSVSSEVPTASSSSEKPVNWWKEHWYVAVIIGVAGAAVLIILIVVIVKCCRRRPYESL